MMDRGETSDSIPIDLVPEILTRVPAKSIARFRCVSKLWGSMLCRLYFTELFLTRSSARPHLLFAVERKGELIFFSSSQRKNTYEKSCLVISTGFHVRLPDPGDMRLHFCGYASGLICFHDQIQEQDDDDTAVHVICSPSTGQCASLPKLERDGKSYSLLGFDPIEKQFKILNLVKIYGDHRILTLGTGELRWREIQGPRGHDPLKFPEICVNGICINGVLYYLTRDTIDIRMVSFDVRSEKFCKVITANCFDDWIAIKLINYKGKLGGIHTHYGRTSGRKLTLELCMCVLEDIEKEEWSEYVYTFPEDFDPFTCFILGVTATGEIVLSRNKTSKPFHVFYLNPERNTLQCVEIQSSHEAFETNNNTVNVFVDHVEDVKFNI